LDANIIDLFSEVYLIFQHFFQWLFNSTSGNVIGIIAIGLAIYFFFKDLKRLVYSIESKNIISDDLKSVENLKFFYQDKKISSLIISELIIYNNGRKSINKNDVSKLNIKSPEGRIFDLTEIKKHNHSIYELTDNIITIKLNKFDSRDYLVLRIFHESDLEIEGRIKESGELLNSENTLWKIINIILIACLFIAFFWSLNKTVENDLTSWKWFVVAVIAGMFIYHSLNFVHSIFFIPTKIIRKYFKRKK